MIFDRQYNPAFPAEWEGLGYESARECTPVWYGVSTGNGNDGISHMFPDYYVRTCEPWTLARAAMISQLKPQWYEWANDAVDIDGEDKYLIHATIYDPPEDDHSECEDGEDCTGCDMCEPDEDMSYSAANGAWILVDVFPMTDAPIGWQDDTSRMCYDSLDKALSADVVTMARDS